MAQCAPFILSAFRLIVATTASALTATHGPLTIARFAFGPASPDRLGVRPRVGVARRLLRAGRIRRPPPRRAISKHD